MSANNHEPAPNILLVEPSPTVAETARSFLESQGHRVYSVGTAPDAVRYLQSRPTPRPLPLILLGDFDHENDVNYFLDYIETRSGPHARILLFTDLPREELASLPRRIRAIGFVASPHNLEGLGKLVNIVLGISEPE